MSKVNVRVKDEKSTTKVSSKKRTGISRACGKAAPARTAKDALSDYVPKTPLGAKLLALRSKIVADSSRILSVDDIYNEVNAQRRKG
jgi:hypothetical protein